MDSNFGWIRILVGFQVWLDSNFGWIRISKSYPAGTKRLGEKSIQEAFAHTVPPYVL